MDPAAFDRGGRLRTGRGARRFLAYIEDVRLAPPRWVACHNSWWTLPLRIGREEHLTLARELAARLQRDHGVFFDIFATDEGWTDPHTIWEVDRHNLPDGFDDIRAIVEGAGGKLGLWMSPSGTYPRSLDYAWAEQNGYFVVQPGNNRGADDRKGVSLASPKYRRKVNEQLRKLIRRTASRTQVRRLHRRGEGGATTTCRPGEIPWSRAAYVR